MNTVSSEGTFPKQIFAKVDVGGTPVKFQLDSGPSCNVISLDTLRECLGHVKLEQTPQVLSMFNKTQIKPLGKSTLDLHNRKTDKSYQIEFVVIQEQRTPLLGSETIQFMDLIQVRFENILSLEDNQKTIPLTNEQLVTQYADVFTGTGKLQGPYYLQIDPDATPVIHPPGKVPLALKTDLKKELDRLESLEILTPVTEPTQWVSSMVIVKKPNCSIITLIQKI